MLHPDFDSFLSSWSDTFGLDVANLSLRKMNSFIRSYTEGRNKQYNSRQFRICKFYLAGEFNSVYRARQNLNVSKLHFQGIL